MFTQAPDFFRITFLSKNETPTVKEEVDLYKIFSAIVEKQKLEVTREQMEGVLKNLTIEHRELSSGLLNVLADAFVYYITNWPGWQRGTEYSSGQIKRKEWYERFRQYLIFKSNYIIKNATKFETEAQSEVIETKNVSVQTYETGILKNTDKKIAPYMLQVCAPPSVLNNIVFIESEGNILIKQHVEKEWQYLSRKEFYNWPHVSICVELPDISFKRINEHRFDRYIALAGDLIYIHDINYLNNVSKLESEGEIKPYTYQYIKAYLQSFTKVTKQLPGILTSRVLELDAIFQQFLADIRSANVYNGSMATNISVGYNIGHSKYVRNRKIMSEDPSRKPSEQITINFYEVLLPQVQFSLKHFNAEQDIYDDQKVSFVSLNNLLEGGSEIFQSAIMNTSITYGCTLCDKSFTGRNAYCSITYHFSHAHGAEQALICFKCRKEFSMQHLAGSRWYHQCVDGTNKTLKK